MAEGIVRLRLAVRGAVQGVGFRPFAYGLARELGLHGFVMNSTQGAEIEIEGPVAAVEAFHRRLTAELPLPGHIAGLETLTLMAKGYADLTIRESEGEGLRTAVVLPDIATCPLCLAEMRDPRDRRYRYPFINCTHCGPRFSIILRLPYDRPNTTMRAFPMCPDCWAEYEDPNDRRFHAQPVACPVCGPQLAFWNAEGSELAARDEALAMACDLLKAGKVLALKGIGGFHLMVDARDDEAVNRLRTRKHREAKPLAVMVPSLDCAKQVADLEDSAERLIMSPEAPIVIVPARPGLLSPSIAPDNPNVGLLLPYSPLHWLLMEELGFPVVATSGNLSEEPICTDELEAAAKFRDIADGILVHNRPIVRPIDDSVARVMAGRPVVFRRARGYAPLPLDLPGISRGFLAVGGHLKNAVALSQEGTAIVGQHVGDLDTAAARDRMEQEVRDLADLYDLTPGAVMHDLHPDYASTTFAGQTGLPSHGVQHHVAHAAGCLAENEIEEPVLAVVWDGTGFGTDGAIWGGEFFAVEAGRIARVGCLHQFSLPGGETAMREPRRSALGVLHEAYGRGIPDLFAEWIQKHFSQRESAALKSMLGSQIGCMRTSSAGRLFDAFASLAAGIDFSRFEGDAPMRFEHLATGDPGLYSFEIQKSNGLLIFDWKPALDQLSEDLRCSVAASAISARFHNGLAEGICLMAERLCLQSVALTGGCFQNRLLFEQTWNRLRKRGVRTYGQQRVPPGDGGLAFGQLAALSKGWSQVTGH